jgi:hypothetical protein
VVDLGEAILDLGGGGAEAVHDGLLDAGDEVEDLVLELVDLLGGDRHVDLFPLGGGFFVLTIASTKYSKASIAHYVNPFAN